MTAVPTNLTAISDMPAEAVIIRRNHRSTSSDPAVIIRRKPRSRSVGIHIQVSCAHYQFPPLDACRKHFEDMAGLQGFDWEGEDAENM